MTELLDPFAKDCPEDLPCRVQDRELWFGERPAELEAAKRFCRPCPARLGCLAGAIERAEPWGVWGGELLRRVIIARKRPRGRHPGKSTGRWPLDPLSSPGASQQRAAGGESALGRGPIRRAGPARHHDEGRDDMPEDWDATQSRASRARDHMANERTDPGLAAHRDRR